LTGAEKDPSPNNYEKAQAALMSIWVDCFVRSQKNVSELSDMSQWICTIKIKLCLLVLCKAILFVICDSMWSFCVDANMCSFFMLLYPLYIWLPVCCVTMPSIYLVICLWCYYTLYVSGYLRYIEGMVTPQTGNQIYRGYSNTTDR
jgi:hypothetical protein